MKQLAITVCALSLAAIAMLCWAVMGYPPHRFFALLTGLTFIASIVAAYFVFRVSYRLSVLSLALLILGIVQLTAKMHRRDWAPYDLVTAAAFAGALTVALFWLWKVERTGALERSASTSVKKQ